MKQDADILGMTFARSEGETEALKEIRRAKAKADAKAARLLAERECPEDLIEWGRIHGIENFARVTWMAGFQAGMRCANLEVTDGQ